MHYRKARAVVLFISALLFPLQASAITSASASYSNTRSSVDNSGRRKTSASYRADGAAGEITAAAGASASYTKRDGLEGIEFYPGRVTGVWGSSGAAPGTVYLQWTAPGDDGYDASTAGSFIVRYSSIVANSPATSDANFNAATNVTPAPPVPSVDGTLMSMTATGLAAGVTYYFAIKAVERDGLRSVLSAGATVQSTNANGCAVVRDVHQVNGPYTTIQSAVNALPSTLPGYSCVIIQDGATYAEQVTVQNFTMNGSSIAIFAGAGSAPTVSPPANSTAAFVIANASASVMGINIAPTSAMTYGVYASSDYVAITSVTMSDAGARISAAGLSLRSWSRVSYSNVNVGGAKGAVLNGSVMTTIAYSTIQASDYALQFLAASSNTISGDYVQGSTAIYVSGSIGTVIGGSVLVATGTAGSALQMDSGSNGLTVSSSVLTAGSAGAAIYLSTGNGGQIVLSTNTLSGAKYGVFVATQTPGAQIWVTSNTIVPAVTSANNTYGLYFNGLTSGATIENNTVAYRTLGSMGSFTSYAVYAQSSSGLLIDHNRFDEPGMITGGSFIAVDAVNVLNTAFKFNDVYSSGTNFTTAFLLDVTAASKNMILEDNVFFSSFGVTLSGSSATVAGDGTVTNVVEDYNDYASSNSRLSFQSALGDLQGLAAYQAASGLETHSISANPLWFNVSAGVEDFHPLSLTGRWSQALQNMSNVDGAQSPTIDAGDPAEGVGAEPAPNGGLANQGSYGLTAQSSESALAPTAVTLVAVGLSSETVSFGVVAGDPNNYVVQASSSPTFSFVLYSSNTTTGATVLAPQGLDPNTTYYLRAGALYGATTVYAQTVLSTATLAQLVSGATVYQVNVTSIVVNWLPLSLSPPAPSSMSATGYELQVSSRSDFTPLWTSSNTPNVLLSTLTVSGLTGGVTYYFRVGSLNWDGAVNYANWTSTTLLPIQLGVMTTTTTIPLSANAAMGATVVISTSIVLTNTGNVSETYSLRATTATAGSKWAIGATPSQDRYTAWTVVNSTAPAAADFSAASQLADPYTSCAPANFTMGNSNCVQVPAGAARTIWVKIVLPLTTTDATNAQQNIQVTAKANKDP